MKHNIATGSKLCQSKINNSLSLNHTINFDGVTRNAKIVYGFWWLS